MHHELKCFPQYYARLADGTKTFEVRKDDRGYQAGDTLEIREYDPYRADWAPPIGRPGYTGRAMQFVVGFVLHSAPGLGLDLGEHVVLSLLPDEQDGDKQPGVAP